jgi:hypothetical protein
LLPFDAARDGLHSAGSILFEIMMKINLALSRSQAPAADLVGDFTV